MTGFNFKIRSGGCPRARKARHKAFKVKVTSKVSKLPKTRRFRVKLPAACRASLETELAECFHCKSVATYQNLCFFHWQEQASYGYFSPDVQEAVTRFNLARAS